MFLLIARRARESLAIVQGQKTDAQQYVHISTKALRMIFLVGLDVVSMEPFV